MNDYTKEIEAFNEVTNTGNKLTQEVTQVNEVQKEMREHSREFYYRLSLLDGGILSLSVTFIGYVASKPNASFNLSELLFLGWFLLTLSLFASLYRNHFYGIFGHWQIHKELNTTRLASEKAVLAAVSQFPQRFINLRSQEEVKEQVERHQNNIRVIEKAIKDQAGKEARNQRFWLLTQNLANISFVLGLTCVIFFAAFNLPVELKFPIIDSISNLFKAK